MFSTVGAFNKLIWKNRFEILIGYSHYYYNCTPPWVYLNWCALYQTIDNGFCILVFRLLTDRSKVKRERRPTKQEKIRIIEQLQINLCTVFIETRGCMYVSFETCPWDRLLLPGDATFLPHPTSGKYSTRPWRKNPPRRVLATIFNPCMSPCVHYRLSSSSPPGLE